MLTCRQFDQFIVDYIDGALTPKQMRVFDVHMALCPMCKAHFETYLTTYKMGQQALGQTDEKVPADMPEELIAAILDTVKSK